jgi:adenosylhomocysteine nucleosidase
LDFIVIVSADAEWRAVRELFAGRPLYETPYGECFHHACGAARGMVVHGGWGKIDAAASAQYAIDRWHPRVMVNLGTCGGIAGQIAPGDTVLAERTIVYDIEERMGDPAAAIRAYSTDIDLHWLGTGALPSSALRVTLLSADRDLATADVPMLRDRYDASAVDWESGAIARVADRNGTRVLILRTVSDLVGEHAGSDMYGQPAAFGDAARPIMRDLFTVLPQWLERALPGCRTPPPGPARTPVRDRGR